MTPLNVAIDGLKFWQPYWDRFLSNYAVWLEDRLAEGEELFFVPITHEAVAFRCTFGTSADDLLAEKAFAELCREFRLAGVRVLDAQKMESNAQFIEYQGLESEADVTDGSWLERGREIGWTGERIESARIALRRADDMQQRLLSSAGRLVCTPAFLAERDSLRSHWATLTPAERPSLPLRPIVRVAEQPQVTSELKLSDPAIRFVEAFEAFCEQWQLNGLETWHLPNPRGPHWPDLRISHGREPPSGTMVLSTPWHFPVLDSDNLGRVAMEQHLADRRRHGIDDARSWQQYVQLLRLDFWKRVLCGRYADNCRPSNFISQVEGLLAEVLDVSADHVEKLVRRHRALISGKLSSLAGMR